MVKLPKKIVSARKLKERKAGAVLPHTVQMSDDRKWRGGPSVLQLEEQAMSDKGGVNGALGVPQRRKQ